MKNNKLRFNADKTKFFIIGTPMQRRKLDGIFLTHTLSQSITPASVVTFDENFNFKQHVSNTCHCYYLPYPWSLSYSQVYLTFHSQNDCNSSSKQKTWQLQFYPLQYSCTAKKVIAKLQRVQNCLARVVMLSPHFSHSMPLLKSLHWFPVHYCIIFHIDTIRVLNALVLTRHWAWSSRILEHNNSSLLLLHLILHFGNWLLSYQAYVMI